MTRERLTELFSGFASLRIAVAGDLFLDRWYEIDESLNESSVETGLTAYQVVRKRAAAGAAGTVLNNLSGIGVGGLEVISLVGEDGDGWEVCRCLQQRGVDTSGVIVSPEVVTPSYIKPLFPKEGNRLDIKNFSPTPQTLQNQLVSRIQQALERCDALILLDQVCEKDTGVLTGYVREAVCQLAKQRPGKLVYADSRAFIHQFHDVVIKCNNREAAQISGYCQDDEAAFDKEQVFACMERLRAKTNRPVIVTCNKYGVAVSDGGDTALVPAVRQPGPIDVCGAGDACTAGLVSALCAGATYREAALVGNLSSGVTVRQIGRTGMATQQAMLALFDEQRGGTN
ncbi:MAG: PfkB family carbohydrate kinase [Clostridiales bacterium]|nr:PfkB family carbohydrate kinase [Clostridiales bacterium]